MRLNSRKKENLLQESQTIYKKSWREYVDEGEIVGLRPGSDIANPDFGNKNDFGLTSQPHERR